MSINIDLPNWLKSRHKVLSEAFNENAFTYEETVKVLKEKNNDNEDTVRMILSELGKAGWLSSSPDPSDARRKIYTLKGEAEAIKQSLQITDETLSRKDIEGILKKAADLIRTRVDYKFILILLFLKRISDKWTIEYETAYKEAIKDGLSEDDAKREASEGVYHDFDIPEEYIWENIRKEVPKLPEKFSSALKEIANRNPDLKDVVDSVDFIQFASSRENSEILRQLFELFSEKKLHNVSPDILGDAYEWILRYFAPSKAKEGEIFTPREVVRLLIEILSPEPKESVYDPACGPGGMLIQAYKYIEEQSGKEEAEKLFLYGQEANNKTEALAKMNMYIHDIKNANLATGDTFLFPKFKEGENLKTFDVVVANPPWNQDGYGEDVLKKGEFWRTRFQYGFPPNQSADWAWIQHMISSARDNGGRVGIVMDSGTLFRGGREAGIRSSIIDKDLLECVILLPEKLFYNTGAPGVLIILRKNKPDERKGKILFINASEEYGKHPDVRKLNILMDSNIDSIAEAYRGFKVDDGFSHIASVNEIADNDYNLNVSLYASPLSETESIDVLKEYQELKNIQEEREQIMNKIETYIAALGDVYDKL
jgi:type I restriction enzyme M protein